MIRAMLLSILLLGIGGSAGAVEVVFKQTAEVNDAAVRLGDIAVFGEKTPLSEALATITVEQAPPPGETVVLRAQAIQHALLTGKAVPEETAWSGSPAITVRRLATTIDAERIMALIADYIHDQQKNLPEAKVAFLPAALPLPFHLPTGELATEVIPSNPGILGSSRFSLIFRIDDQVVKNMSVRGRVEATADIVVASQILPRGSILRPEMLSVAPADISNLSAPHFEPNDLVGKLLTRSLKAGSPILGGMVESLPVVRRGEKVKMVLNSGPLHLTASGFAHTDGRLDEMIRVQNLSSNKLVYCRVAAPGVVEVLL